MGEYRLYYLDRDGHIVQAEGIACTDDDEAIQIGRQRLKERGGPVELWSGARRVGFVSSETPA